MRLRILAGSFALVALLVLYALAAMAIAARLPPDPVVVFGFYAFAGIAWVAPAALLTRWMQRARPYRPPPTP